MMTSEATKATIALTEISMMQHFRLKIAFPNSFHRTSLLTLILTRKQQKGHLEAKMIEIWRVTLPSRLRLLLGR